MNNTMTSPLDRFVEAQSPVYDQVLAELKRGRKESHWMWFIFPQLKALGVSSAAQHYGISGPEEARAYLKHPVLSQRLRECASLVNAIENRSVDEIFGYPDNLKFRSCVTLFAAIATDDEVFRQALEKYFDGSPDTRTIELLQQATPDQKKFDAAADAIVSGDIETLRALLQQHPELIRMRSNREHRSTLLHYVSANGVEGFRQKTPPNILEITRLLLDAGADVNAKSDAYAGDSTTLMLTATSCHPEAAGVQTELLQLLIDSGGVIDTPPGTSTVNACLHNGRGLAAAFLATKGATLDFEGAAGTGRLDLVQGYPSPTEAELNDALAWACQFGHTDIARHLLERGVPIGAKVRHHGQTGLHWAAYGGYPDVARLLIEKGAPLDTTDDSFGGTPLDWALHAWANATVRKQWPAVVALLIRAGAKVNPDVRNSAKLKSDPAMQAALNGEG